MTTPNGGSPAPGVSTASPTVPASNPAALAQQTNGPEKTEYSKTGILNFLKSKLSGGDEHKGQEPLITPLQEPEDTSSDEAQAAQEDVPAVEQSTDKPDAEEKKSEDQTVPLKAFQERIGKLNAKVKEAEGKFHAAQLDNNKLKQAVNLLYEEKQQMLAALVKSGLLTDEQVKLNSFEFRSVADQHSARIEKEHQEALQKAQAEAESQEKEQERFEAIKEAQAKFPLAHWADMDYLMEKHPDTPAMEIAQWLHNRAVSKVQPKKPTTSTPTTTKPAGTRSAPVVKPSYTKEGIMEFLAQQGLKK